MTDVFEWTNLLRDKTGLPCTIWVRVDGVVATNPYHPEKLNEHAAAVGRWMMLNQRTLRAHARGDIDGIEMAARVVKLPT
jgi:hypothetical protein